MLNSLNNYQLVKQSSQSVYVVWKVWIIDWNSKHLTQNINAVYWYFNIRCYLTATGCNYFKQCFYVCLFVLHRYQQMPVWPTNAASSENLPKDVDWGQEEKFQGSLVPKPPLAWISQRQYLTRCLDSTTGRKQLKKRGDLHFMQGLSGTNKQWSRGGTIRKLWKRGNEH